MLHNINFVIVSDTQKKNTYIFIYNVYIYIYIFLKSLTFNVKIKISFSDNQHSSVIDEFLVCFP